MSGTEGYVVMEYRSGSTGTIISPVLLTESHARRVRDEIASDDDGMSVVYVARLERL